MSANALYGLKGLALITVWSTLALLALGNVVTTTNSGLGCGDHWPSCNGELIPDLSNMNVVIEFGHRVLAAFVGLFTLLTTIAAWRVQAPQHQAALRTASTVALVLLIAQIALGAVTVRFELPSPVVIMHLAVSMAFFAALIMLTQFADEVQRERIVIGVSGNATARFHSVTLWTAVVVYLQIVLGAYLRHSGAGLACPDVPLCQGRLIPPLNGATLTQLGHRLLGLIAAALVMGVAARARRSQLSGPQLNQARWAAILVVVQIGLGVMSVISLLSPFWTTLHLITAAMLLAILVSLSVQTRPSTSPETAQKKVLAS